MPLPLGYTTFVNIKYATFYFIFLIMKLLGNPKIKKKFKYCSNEANKNIMLNFIQRSIQ
jgi:hypothetical protein